VTCVCSKYALDRTETKLVLATEELYTTTNMTRVLQCNNLNDSPNRAAEVDNRKHFNCRPVAKEDLRFERFMKLFEGDE